MVPVNAVDVSLKSKIKSYAAGNDFESACPIGK
jgi:hypothetical protein